MATTPAPADTLASLRARLEQAGQGHLLAFADQLPADALAGLVQRLGALDLEELAAIIERHRAPAPAHAADRLDPPVVSSPAGPPTDAHFEADAARRAGLDLIASGRVAALTVAGGQGTRLGFPGPKGTLAVAPVSGRTLFEVFADQISAASRHVGRPIPWLIMTSPQNHEQTVGFFGDRGWLGLEREQVRFFTQGAMPSFDPDTGRLLLADKDRLATNPDGHGGVVAALVRSGELDRLEREGVEHLSYFQVDNPLAIPLDPLFLGAHAGAGGARSSGRMSSKMVPKAHAGEKVGVFASRGGRTVVVEYSDLPEELACATEADGRLRYEAGSTAIHAASTAFFREVHDAGEDALPFHRALKKVPHLDPETGRPVQPDAPNAVKLERFVFDALPLAGDSLVLRCEREREFAPVKNASGADSVESAQALQVARARRWLAERGLETPRRADGSPADALELSGEAAWADAAGLPHTPPATPAHAQGAVL